MASDSELSFAMQQLALALKLRQVEPELQEALEQAAGRLGA